MSCGCSGKTHSCGAAPSAPVPAAPVQCGPCQSTSYKKKWPTGCGCGSPRGSCSCHEPETPLCVPCGTPICEPCESTQRAIKVHISLDPSDAGTCFPIAVCECGEPGPDISKLKAKIRRRGQCNWILEYPAWDCSDCGIEFRWDNQLYSLPKGRYELQFFNDCNPCGMVEIKIDPKCPINPTKYTTLKARAVSFPASPPPGGFPVFDAIASFSANLCSHFEKGATMLPLCQPDIATLCAITLCKPVQLMITDGFNSELVTFTGCTSGTPLVTRGAPQFKFPKGSSVKFVWSTQNVQAACSPCP